MASKKRIAIVHDALVVYAGSEKLALHLSNIYPDAPVYTSAYLPENTFPEFKTRKVITLPFAARVRSERHFKQLFLLWYLEFSRLDLSAYDVVISSANYLAKFITPPASTRHICYLHNAFRFLWKRAVYSEQSLPYGGLALAAINPFIPLLQRIDAARTRSIMDRPGNAVVTNSQNMARHLHAVYDLTPEVIYPPVPVSSFWIADAPQDYYLYAGRLISHKRVDIVIQACQKMNRRLIVAGDGLERSALEALAGENVTFTGKVSDAELRRLYANCRALIFPSNEDFGIVPVEAQAAGRPVIAFQAGGALETVVEFETGMFFKEQSVDSLCEAMRCFEQATFDPLTIRQNAMRFDQSHFEEAVRALVDREA
ncbi:MAG TPA: glycosyltransferase [Anaerolineaceae bacterium]